MIRLKCPFCSSPNVVASHGVIRCGSCGAVGMDPEVECLPSGFFQSHSLEPFGFTVPHLDSIEIPDGAERAEFRLTVAHPGGEPFVVYGYFNRKSGAVSELRAWNPMTPVRSSTRVVDVVNARLQVGSKKSK